ncbi:MAG: mechanosensitive ion channel family protein [Candidatus Thermoplasmatota archaeon]|jgi:small-conductance mechanosensitive channel|nr:mechanosensitive ion channel family protein [Candidatus Thermoplasmatota archaeon]MCL5793490.1 mechanosensitive ion channel family protein [Candidatus Thermoplasmatota archaeon]
MAETGYGKQVLVIGYAASMILIPAIILFLTSYYPVFPEPTYVTLEISIALDALISLIFAASYIAMSDVPGEGHHERNLKIGRLLRSFVAMIMVLAFVLVTIYLITTVYDVIPVGFSRLVNALVIVVVAYLIFRVVLNFVRMYLSRFMSPAKIHPIIFLITLAGYFIIGVATLAGLGVNVSSVILGGSLFSVVLGLAAQTVLSNQFGGILLTVVRPFSIGDYITINTWQYGGAFPVLFPKYFSEDRIESTAYTGVVKEISINYTTLRLNSGDLVKLPNGIVVIAAIIVRKREVVVQARYETPKYVEFSSIRDAISEGISKIQGSLSTPNVYIDETTMNSYIVKVVGRFSGIDSDGIRSKMLALMMNIVEPRKSSSPRESKP